MRIALVMPSLDVGGVERVMLSLAKWFFQRGISVDLVVTNASGPLRKEIPANVQLIDLKASRVIRGVPKLVSYLRKSHPDAIISAKDYQNIVALWAVKLARIAITTIISTHIDVSVDWKHAHGFKAKAIPYLVRYFYPWADHIVTVSEGARKSLVSMAKLKSERIQVIYNPVITRELLDKANEPVDHPWFVFGEPPVILSAGRLTEQKDYSTLIQAFVLVRKHCPARLMIFGDGEDRSRLEALVRELELRNDVALPGFVDNPYTYMTKAAVFVLSSAWEGLPNVLIEAMAVETPVIATDCPSGPREILEDGKWRRLVPVGDVKALAGAIIETLKQAPVNHVRQRGMATLYILSYIVERYLEVLNVGRIV